ncbi:MerR family transcriptional regulator [Paenibacillus koleovorans]|uniref:MerR family transcriptional regulator n=1 Tax=Paenibacillus koleovorans TaxID=121608 RepID=UPI000FD95823|nr:methyltransferase domain-containing protein [Paenibacillus koleovorans]
MNIRTMAERLGMSARTIRFYEQKGLLKPERNTENDYRIFTEADAWRLQLIAALRELDVPLEEISRLMEELLESPIGESRETGVDASRVEPFLAYLNVQRSLTYRRWVEMKGLLVHLDELIEQAADAGGLRLEQLFELARKSKAIREARSGWADRWRFDERAADFDETVRRAEGVQQLAPAHAYDRLLEETAAAVNPVAGERGLDLGTGTGNLAVKLMAAGVRMAGVDQSAEMLKVCKAKHPGLDTKLGNLMAVPFFDGEFDLVVSSFALRHLTVEQLPLALEEIARVLKPGGRVALLDAMLEDTEQRNGWLERNGDGERAQGEGTFPVRKQLLDWFRSHGFVAYAQRLEGEWLSLVVAVKRV